MAFGLRRDAERGFGVGFIVAMVIVLVLAVQAFQGPTSVILLVIAGVFLLAGLYFLTGTPESTETAPVPAPAVAPTAVTMVVCRGCQMRINASFLRCPYCGTPR